MWIHHKTLLMLALFGLFPTLATPTRFSVTGQSAKFPLYTQITIKQQQDFRKLFSFKHFQAAKAVALRPQLKPLAAAGDPVAQFWYGQSFDFYGYGLGNSIDGAVALKWYQKAADRGFAEVEVFLATSYRYAFLNLKTDEQKVLDYWQRATLHGNNSIKADILLEYARLYQPDEKRSDFKMIPQDGSKLFAALAEAYRLDSTNATTISWYGSLLFERQSYAKALAVLKKSSNGSDYRRVASMYELGQGTAINLSQAVAWYKRAINDERSNSQQNTSLDGALGDLYRLICQKKISQASAKPYFLASEYKAYQDFAGTDCIITPGG
jgi:TPR repeat protein